MKKIIIAYILMLCVFVTSCTMTANKAKDEQAHFAYEFADAEKGTQLLLANTKYHDNLTKADLEYKMQKKGASKEDYIEFAKDQVMEFTSDEKAVIDECMQQIEQIIVRCGYKLPKIDTVNFVKTTMKEEGGAAAYTHSSDIYLSVDMLNQWLLAPEEEKIYYTATMLHELFHCITRNDSDFRKDMYGIIGFTVAEKDFEILPQIKERMISNPDVGHHDSYAAFTINGEIKDCFAVFLTTKDFENPGESFFDNAATHLIPIDSTDTVYTMDDAEDFWEVFGENTSYVIDPEECLADNFAYAFLNEEEGVKGVEWPNPEIIEKVLELLHK